jgi:hypothetical protein
MQWEHKYHLKYKLEYYTSYFNNTKALVKLLINKIHEPELFMQSIHANPCIFYVYDDRYLCNILPDISKYNLLLSFKQPDKTSQIYIKSFNTIITEYNDNYEIELKYYFKFCVLIYLKNKVIKKDRKIQEEIRRKELLESKKRILLHRQEKNKLSRIKSNSRIKHKQYFKDHV